jgi:hypothetical protein
MPIPETILDDIATLFVAWRTHPDYDGSTLIPRAHFYVDSDLAAVVMFPSDDVQPLAKSLYDVTATVGMLGDGIVVMCETWMKIAKEVQDLDHYEKGDLSKDASSGQAIVVMQITMDTFEVNLLPFGIDDHGIIAWDERVALGPEALGGAMPEIVLEAQRKSRPMHEAIRQALDIANQIGTEIDPDEEPISMGPVYRGALGALAEMGEYMIAMTGELAEMP